MSKKLQAWTDAIDGKGARTVRVWMLSTHPVFPPGRRRSAGDVPADLAVFQLLRNPLFNESPRVELGGESG